MYTVNTIDQILSGEEPIVRMIEDEQGILAAERFVDMFNNACTQIAGFEHVLAILIHSHRRTLAPPTNLSYLEH